MSKDMNIVVIIGRLVRDPEIRYTPSGTPVARFSIANGERIKQNNEWTDHTNFFDIVVFGNQAVNCEKYLKKGSQVSVEGTLRQNRWNDATTNQGRSKIEILANSVQFLTPVSNQGQTSGQAIQGNQSYSQNNNATQQQQVRPAVQQPQGQDVIPDPWGDSNFSSGSDDYSAGNSFQSDDDIPF